jgi:hypothetical protein
MPGPVMILRTMASTRAPHPAGSRIRAVVAAVLAFACLVSCGTPPVEEHAAEAAADGSGLAGTWHLEAGGEPDDAVLSLAGGELSLIRPCVSVDGTWAARGGLFLADMPDELNRVVPHPGCPAEPHVGVPGWLTSAVRYVAANPGWRLLGADGETVATLRPGAQYPDAAPTTRVFSELNRGDGRAVRPGFEERARMNSTPAAALPPGVRAAGPNEVVGRWEPEPAQSACDRPYLDLRADGTWAGHDEANDIHGRWVAGEDGLALGTATQPRGPGCVVMAGAPAPKPGSTAVDGWMLRLARAGFRGQRLVLLDATGSELAALTRRTPPDAADDIDRDGLSDSAGDGHVARTYTPEPRDPRREGVAVPGGTTYLVRTDEHQFDLAPFNVTADYERSWAPGQVLGIDHTGRAGKILTGCAMGDVWLTVRTRTSPPPALAKAMHGWEVGEEETMTIDSALSAVELMGFGAEEIFTPSRPGLHRVRLLAKGRALQYDEVCRTPIEHYELTIWPEDVRTPPIRRGDDGV